MSSKNSNQKTLYYNTRSITGRLALLYTLSALATLAAFSIFFAWSIYDSMSRGMLEFLDERLQAYNSIIRTQENYLEIIRQDIEWDGKYVDAHLHFERILDAKGMIRIEAVGMGDLLPASWFPVAADTGIPGINGIVRKAGNGRYYLLKTVATEAASNNNEKLIVQIGLDITESKKIFAEKERVLIPFFFLGILVATAVGILVARKALSPVKEITGVAEQINISQIGTRLEPQQWPEELRSFAVAFNGMLSRLEQSFSSLSQCLSNLAHELRTPIDNLIGEAQVVLAHDRPAEEYRTTIESGVEEYQRLSRIINSMLFIARAENPATRIELILFDPIAEIEKVRSFYDAVAEEHGAVITVSGSGILHGDPLMFSRAISNLLANAIYYSPQGVYIDITVTTLQDGAVKVTVRDSGYGIPENELSRIFDRFYRGEKMRVVHPEGSGLGLNIVKSIMDLHDGSVTIESQPGKGTAITLHFPPPSEHH